jgi:hypothetical protein
VTPWSGNPLLPISLAYSAALAGLLALIVCGGATWVVRMFTKSQMALLKVGLAEGNARMSDGWVKRRVLGWGSGLWCESRMGVGAHVHLGRHEASCCCRSF